jgi:CRP-like cAMP-binding protein
VNESDICFVKKIFEGLAGEYLPDIQSLEAKMSVISLNKGDYLFQAESLQPYIYLVKSGLLKMVYEMASGDEWVKAFVQEYMFLASVSALNMAQASFSVIAIEDCSLIKIDYPAIEHIAECYPAWQKLLTNSFKLYGARKEKRERSLLVLNAEQRYQDFLKDYPQLESRLMQKDIAAYIRVTPVAFSRIKKRFLQRGD